MLKLGEQNWLTDFSSIKGKKTNMEEDFAVIGALWYFVNFKL